MNGIDKHGTDLRRRHRHLTGHPDWVVTAVAIAPDGTWLAVACDDNNVRIRDIAISIRPTPAVVSFWEAGVAIAPDGASLATAQQDVTVQIRDTATGDIRATLKGHTSWVHAMAIGPDGTWLATASHSYQTIPICRESPPLAGVGPGASAGIERVRGMEVDTILTPIRSQGSVQSASRSLLIGVGRLGSPRRMRTVRVRPDIQVRCGTDTGRL